MSSELKIKEVGVHKVSSKSGNVGVIDLGDRGKVYHIDLDEIDALSVLDHKHNADMGAIMQTGQDGKNFQKKQLGLTDNETGELDPELVALITLAASGESQAVTFVDAGDGFVSIAVEGDWSTDILRFEGTQLNKLLADLADFQVVCDALDKGVDLKDGKSDVGVFIYDAPNNKTFSGDDGNVDSAAVKAILGGSKLELDEAIELTEYALSEAGQADSGITIDFTGSSVILEIEASGSTVDTLILKGEAYFDAFNDSINLKNSASQIGLFDFDEKNSFFSGDDGNVDSAAAKAIIGGSKIEAGEADELVALALSGDDPDVRYLGGDDDSAIIAIEASGSSVDTLLITGDAFDFA
ncbi:MAG: hypothetical protein AAGI13_00785 [Pseudomonadota bacterium]